MVSEEQTVARRVFSEAQKLRAEERRKGKELTLKEAINMIRHHHGLPIHHAKKTHKKGSAMSYGSEVFGALTGGELEGGLIHRRRRHHRRHSMAGAMSYGAECFGAEGGRLTLKKLRASLARYRRLLATKGLSPIQRIRYEELQKAVHGGAMPLLSGVTYSEGSAMMHHPVHHRMHHKKKVHHRMLVY